MEVKYLSTFEYIIHALNKLLLLKKCARWRVYVWRQSKNWRLNANKWYEKYYYQMRKRIHNKNSIF